MSEVMEKMRLCPHGKKWLAAGHVCCCQVLFEEWKRRRYPGMEGHTLGKSDEY